MYDMPPLETQILRTVITFQKDGKTNFLYIPYVRAYHKVKHLGIAVCYISQLYTVALTIKTQGLPCSWLNAIDQPLLVYLYL